MSFKIFSTFTGAGGLDIGFHGDFDFLDTHYPKLNFKTVKALEINNQACETLENDNKYFKDTDVINADITKVNPNDFKDEDYDVLLGGFPCFVAGTKIYTDIGYKNIEDIKIGDKVITHNNRFKKVELRMINKTERIYHIKAMGIPRIETTSNHPFYALKKGWKKPQWIEAKDLEKGYFLSMPINEKSIIPIWNGINSKTNQTDYKIKNKLSDMLNKDIFWWLIGRYIADGWLINYPRKDRKSSEVYKVYLCAGKHEKISIEKSLNKLNLHFTIDEDKTTFKYIFSNEELYKFLSKFGKYAYGKTITPEILDLPNNLLKSFLDGYLSGDGNFYKNTWSFNTVSETLAYGLQQIIHKVHRVPCTLLEVKKENITQLENRVISQKMQYRGSFKLNASSTQAFIQDNLMWLPFRKTEIFSKEVPVYNLEVEEDNSYTANNSIVHNCVTFSIVGKQIGLQDDINGKLYENFVNFVEVLQPKVFLAENVKGILSANRGEAIKIITKRFEDTGYNLQIHLVNFADYGVPQLRQRVLFIGVRDDIKEKFILPKPTHKDKHITSQEAFKNLNTKCINHNFIKQLPTTTEKLKAIPEGGNFKDLPPHLAVKGRMSNIYRKLDRNKPAYTVLASGGGGTWTYHYEEPRALSNRERARLQAFPDDLIFMGSNTEVRRQIGNAVPAVGVYYFAKEIERVLKN